MRAVPIALPDSERHRAENFPVASWLCPPRLRPPILAIYRFARFADDLADEGQVEAAERQRALQDLRDQLRLLEQGADADAHYATLLRPLALALREHQLPSVLLHDLLDAFVQDTHQHAYADRAGLLDYCRRSANPVGRLLLHLVGVQDAESLRAADAICTGLQLVNFWQDVGVDRLKGRIYLPLEALNRHGVTPEALRAGKDSAALRACVAEQLDWASSLLEQGRALPPRVPGRLGWELRLVIEGGLRIAEKIRAMDHATLLQRPRLRAWDAPLLLLRALKRRLLVA